MGPAGPTRQEKREVPLRGEPPYLPWLVAIATGTGQNNDIMAHIPRQSAIRAVVVSSPSWEKLRGLYPRVRGALLAFHHEAREARRLGHFKPPRWDHRLEGPSSARQIRACHSARIRRPRLRGDRRVGGARSPAIDRSRRRRSRGQPFPQQPAPGNAPLRVAQPRRPRRDRAPGRARAAGCRTPAGAKSRRPAARRFRWRSVGIRRPGASTFGE